MNEKVYVYITRTILTPLIETPDPPNDTPGPQNRWFWYPDIPRILSVVFAVVDIAR